MKITSDAQGERKICDECLADTKTPQDQKKLAKRFCIECNENLCENCNDSHAKLKATRSHRTNWHWRKARRHLRSVRTLKV